MPTIRRPGSPAAEPHAAAAHAPSEGTSPGEHSLSPLHVPEDTTPTWELEMLVSGAVLFGLFQLPPLVDGVWLSMVPRLATQFSTFVGVFAFAYVKGMVYALMVAFVVHLASRAYWVAMVGLDSVFPEGVRWDASRYGPITKELVRDRLPTLPRMISAVDNFCSVVFAVGFITVSLAILSLSTVGFAGLVAWAGSTAFFGGAHAQQILMVTVWLLLLPVLVMALDRRLGARLRADGRAAAVVRGIVRYSYQVIAIRFYGPIFLTLITNVRKRVALPLLFALLFGSMALAFSDAMALRGNSTASVYPALPEALHARALDYRHYADQRTGATVFARVPFIQSDVVRDPYVRLFTPYNVRQDAHELGVCMRSAAPSVPPAGGAAIATGAASADLAESCLAAIHAVSLNGRPRTDLDHRFYTDAASGLQGLLVYIPVADLPHGRNLLTVRRPAQADDDGRLQSLPPDSIAFWL